MANDFVNDVNDLNLSQGEQLDWGAYEDQAERKVTPQPGAYDVQLPNEFKYKQGREGQLVIALDPLTFVGGDHAGFTIRFAQVSTKKFKNSNACQAGDVLRNVGSVATPHTGKEWASAFEDIAGCVANGVKCVYRGWDKIEKKEYTQEMFPKREDGTIQAWIDLPTEEVDIETGEIKTRRVWANLAVDVRGFAVKKV